MKIVLSSEKERKKRNKSVCVYKYIYIYIYIYNSYKSAPQRKVDRTCEFVRCIAFILRFEST